MIFEKGSKKLAKITLQKAAGDPTAALKLLNDPLYRKTATEDYRDYELFETKLIIQQIEDLLEGPDCIS